MNHERESDYLVLQLKKGFMKEVCFIVDIKQGVGFGLGF